MKLFKQCAFLRGLILSLWLMLGFTTSAQQDPRVEVLTTNNGLAQGMIHDIIQDQEGFIWFATKDGLNRYDGYEFKVFTNDPSDPWSISGNTVIDLFEDTQGRIWVTSSTTGINIYDKATGRFHRIQHNPLDPTSLSGNNVTSIIEDTSGYFICAVDKQEVNMFKVEESFFEEQVPPKVIRISMPDESLDLPEALMHGIDKSKLKTIIQDAEHRIWVAGLNTIYQLEVATAALVEVKHGLSFMKSSADEDGSFWGLSARRELCRWDNEVATYFTENGFGEVQTVAYHKGNLWVLTMDELYGFDVSGKNRQEGSLRNLGDPFFHWIPDSLQVQVPFFDNPMLIDRSGLVWIGLRGRGVVKVNPKASRFSHGAKGSSIRSFYKSQSGKLYHQSFSAVWFNDNGQCLDRATFDIPGEACFSANLKNAKNGDCWVKNKDLYKLDSLKSIYMLRRYNPTTGQSKDYELSWHHDILCPMIETSDSALWLSGFDGVLAQVKSNIDEVSFYDLNTGQQVEINVRQVGQDPQYSSTALFEDIDEVLWVGTERGMSKCIRSSEENSPLEVTKYVNVPDDENSLSYNHVTSFLDDPNFPKRYLWVSTKGGGLNRFDKKTGDFLRLTEEDGLPNKVVYGLLSDNAGNIWGSTNKGLFCMFARYEAGSVENVVYSFRNFTKEDGLQEDEFNTGAFAKLSDSLLVFGGVNGYSAFNPKEVLSGEYIPNTYITNISVNNQLVKTGDSTGFLENTIQVTSEIELSHLDKVLTLEFASLDFTAADKNRYRYQFTEGKPSDKWIDAGNRRSATFINLQPDEYIFRVQGSNSQGVWNGPVAELKVSVLPPWWKTWWAYLIYGTLMLTAALLYFRFSVNREKLEQQVVYEKREAERVKELDGLKTQLYMNMTHEFRTPLTVILGMAKQMKDNPRADVSRNLDMVINNGRSLLDMVNQMLNLSRLESGKMSVKMIQGDLILYLHTLVESFRSFMGSKDIQLHFLSEVDDVMMDYDADKIKQIVSNLLSNAFKFTPKGGNIYVTSRVADAAFILKVKDTGKGIPKHDLQRIFDRFYQVDNTTTRKYDGSGIGLSLTKELVTLMGGTITVQSPPAGARVGTEFTVTLPVTNVAPEELLTTDQQSDALDATTYAASSIISAGKQGAGEFDSEKPLVLIAEDNEDVAVYVSSCLYGEYRLAIAKNGQEGLELAIELIPDLIVSDVMMPIMDGFEFCRKVKSDSRTDHIPVIILTARADFDSKIEGLELGANAYLPKPFEELELLFTVKNLLDLRDKQHRYYQGAPRQVVVGQLEAEIEVVTEQPPVEDPFVLNVRAHIEAQLDNADLSVEQLAKELHLSHSQFGRKLNALTGLSPNKFIRATRLNKAKELLQDQESTITEVSYACGFNDPSYFTRVFKKEFGVAPLEWRTGVL